MSSRRRFIVAACALHVLGGCASLVPAPRVAIPGPDEALAAWSRVLDSFVDARGTVDFEALSRDRSDLDRYVRFVAETRLDTSAGAPHRLAHMINAYNALAMFNVIESGIPHSHAGLNKLVFFVGRKLQVGGQAMSLYHFENEVIRPFTRRLGDPRVHFALNCMALSCPVLPRVPFAPGLLDEQLERESRAFFARPQNFRIDAAARTVWLNEVLKFYSEDFVPAHGRNLIEYANRFAPQPAPLDHTIAFTPCDWTIANRRRTGG